ncbi:hypothetical protein F7725_010404 [Dissostichus mawsoni]|uniref:Pre-PUA domain-containing protein n=1 Tax=Dissostichus mawsoni TaxID=36200 RepID=A0A7J5XND6_DISMA|nr:hypothetical protein F7725_010404 [Dissostichus mawsoni]
MQEDLNATSHSTEELIEKRQILNSVLIQQMKSMLSRLLSKVRSIASPFRSISMSSSIPSMPPRVYCWRRSRRSLRASFDDKENVSNCIQLKTSVIKGIKNQLLEQFPDIETWLNHIMPKKDPVKIVRCHEHIEILTVNGELLFFRQREGPFYPTLRLLHKYPFILPHQQVDKGAIKFVLSGANIMCPGLTSPGAKLYPAAADTAVMSADSIEKVNKGIGIENVHYLNDGLWHMKTYK